MVWRESPCLSVEAGDPGARRIQGFLAEPLCAVGSSTAASDTLQIVKGESLTILPPQSRSQVHIIWATKLQPVGSALKVRLKTRPSPNHDRKCRLHFCETK